MKILFLTNLLPYPLDNGGKIKTYTTLKTFANAGHNIDLLCFKETSSSIEEDMETELHKICRFINQVYTPITTVTNKKYMIGIAIKSLFSSLPFSIYKYQSKKMRKKIEEQLNTQYDIVYFDHLPMCVYLSFAHKLWPKARMILDEHNCETVIAKRKIDESHNILKKIFFIIEAYKLEKFEVSSIKNVNKTIVLSTVDYITLKRLTNYKFPHSIIPISVPDRGIKKYSDDVVLNILFIGTLTWEPNNVGLIWFLKEVMPIIEYKNLNIHLYIVGKNPSKDVRNLCNFHKEKVTVTGYVDSVDEYYDLCDVTIVPLFIGSGQRVKLIEAFSKGMPAISTTIGAEGLEYINNESIIIADNKNEFADAIELMQDKNIREKLKNNSRKIYEQYYSPEAILPLIEASLKG